LSKEGFGIISGLLAFVIVTGILTLLSKNGIVTGLFLVSAILVCFVVYFFRDPIRKPPQDARAIVSPADGRVLEVTTVNEPNFIGGEATRVAIFLSVMDVHVNYVPFAGLVEHLKYNKGKFYRANVPAASSENENTFIGLRTAYGKLVFKQSSGILARRIVCHLKLGDKVATGQKFGIIKFGSRMEVYLPSWATVTTKMGDRLRAGESVIAMANEK
jgi:phosphatidylserine decarboxylase